MMLSPGAPGPWGTGRLPAWLCGAAPAARLLLVLWPALLRRCAAGARLRGPNDGFLAKDSLVQIALAARLLERDKSAYISYGFPSGHPSCFSAPAANPALYAVIMDRRRISLGFWALATVLSFGPGARRPASPRRRVSAALRGSSGDAPPGGSDAIYAGLRARCEQLQAAAARELTDLADLRHAWVVLF